MLRFSSLRWSAWLTAGLFGLLVALPLLLNEAKQAGAYALEVRMKSSHGGTAQLFYDSGRGINEGDSVHSALRANQEIVYRFPLPADDYREFRFDPTDREDVFTIFSAQLVDSSGRVLREVRPDQFQPVQQLAPGEVEGGARRFRTTPGANDPIMMITGLGPIALHPGAGDRQTRHPTGIGHRCHSKGGSGDCAIRFPDADNCGRLRRARRDRDLAARKRH